MGHHDGGAVREYERGVEGTCGELLDLTLRQ
jgi:hypothetical protein